MVESDLLSPAPPDAPEGGATSLASSRSAAPDTTSSFDPDRAPERATIYWAIGLLLLGGSLLLRNSPWITGPQLHTLMEVAATTLAFMAGSLALVRFYSRKQGTILLIGVGFLGAGALDLYHAFITSELFRGRPGASMADISAWSWTASRVYLSLFLFVSLLAWRREMREEGSDSIQEGSVYLTAAILTLVNLVFFALVPLSSAYQRQLFFARPGEFIPALFFGLTFGGYLMKGAWRRDAFEHWLLISLLISTLAHAAYMSQSQYRFDAMFDAAHLLKVASYASVLTGLLISVYLTFRREEEVLGAIRLVNSQLAREIRVRREAEKVLQESEERLQHFLDTAHDLIQSTGPQGRFLYANRAWQDTLGYSTDELRRRTIYDIVAPERRDEFREAMDEVLAGRPVTRILVEYVAKDGRTVICSGSAAARWVNGRPVAIQGIFRDVTEQKRAERELAASRANLAALVENTGDAIWSIDRRQRLITFNSAFALAVEASTGREPRVGSLPREVFGADDGPWYRDIYTRALRGERFSELKEEDAEGQLRYFEVFLNPIQDESGITGAVMFGKDVTARLRAEEALRIAKEDAVAANQAKSQFLANMSHELRTPLNSVIGFANILLKNKKQHLDTQETNFLQRIHSNGRHLLALINEILDLAKIESGRMELEILEIDLGSLVRDTLAALEGQVKDKDVVLKALVPETVKPLETDPHKLKQVIINLVGNALKFTDHGHVAVRVDATRDGVPTAISVEDTGIGIPPERLDAIFEAFQQAEEGTSRKYGGTGLGLTISRSMCQLMGYDLTVDSVEGEGSVFRIVLSGDRPGEEAPEPGADGGGEAEATDGDPGDGAPLIRDFTILVIDDEADSRILMGHYLEEFGCRVLMASGAEEGLEIAREHHPDLITLDLMMPGTNGWDALRVLKDDPDLREIPVVVVSIVAKEGRGRLLGAVDLITKPVEREDLLRVLWRNLVRQRGGRVLVVEDDADTRQLLVEYLEESGLEVRSAANGREALRAVEKEAPDAVLLDLMMPVMDGMSFLNELRSNPYHAGLPVIVITAKDLTPEERSVLEENASGIIVKGDEVRDRLRALLGTLFPTVTR